MISDTNRQWMAAFVEAMYVRFGCLIAFGLVISLCACSTAMADDAEGPQPSDVTLLATPFVRTFIEPQPYVLKFTDDGQHLLATSSDGSIFVLSVPALDIDTKIQIRDTADLVAIETIPGRHQFLVVSEQPCALWLVDDSGETEPRKLFEAYIVSDCQWIEQSRSVGVIGTKKLGEAAGDVETAACFWRIDIETGEVLEETTVDDKLGTSLRCSSSSGLLLRAYSPTPVPFANNWSLYWRDADADTFAALWRLDASDSSLRAAEWGVKGNRVFAVRWCGTQKERRACFDDGRSAQAEIRCIDAPSGDVLYSVRDERPVGERTSARDLALIGRRPLLATVGTGRGKAVGGWGGFMNTGELQIRSTRDGRLIAQQRTNYGLQHIAVDPSGNWIATLGRWVPAEFVTMWKIVPEVEPPDAAGQ